VGGALARAGYPVTLLVRSGRRDHYPERITIESEALGAFEAPVRVADRLDEQVDVVWIGPGRIHHLSAFADVQVAPGSATRALAEAISDELRGAGLTCEVSEDEVTMLWTKLCFLAPFALATTASGNPLGAIRSEARLRALMEASVNEACAVGVAEGARVAPGPILAALEGMPDGFRSSMQKDVAAGHPPEVDAIAGPILRGGREHGIDVSATRALVDQIVAPQ
jgi:2-dehydropantoate 2-reductase